MKWPIFLLLAFTLSLLSLLFLLPKGSSFELSIENLDSKKVVSAGDTVQIQVFIKNREESGRNDVNLTYSVFKEGVLLTETKEVRAIETQASFIKELTIPENTIEGLYVVQVQINDEEIAEDTLTVTPVLNPLSTIQNYFIVLFSAVLFLGIIILWEVHKINLGVRTKK